MKSYLVFDWGGTFIKYARMNEDAEILDKGKIPSPKKSDTKEIFYETIDQIVADFPGKPDGIAISSPGIIDSTKGEIQVIGSFPYLNNAWVKKELEERYQIPVSIENDGKSAALAELWKGNLHDVRDGAVVVIGTGIGGGIILDGKLRRGQHFFAGEYSAVNLNAYSPEEDDSYWGALGHRGLSKEVAKRTGENHEELDGVEVFRRINAGDAAAQEALRAYCDRFALELFNLNIVLDLSRICIGGGISVQPKLLEYLKDSIEGLKQKHPDIVSGTALPLPEVAVCRFYNDANLIGALYHHLYEREA
ncbi:MAG: ROK family protein [Solobacterium sp.]|nr:ROK family protein [Solobacterium sp.]